MQWLSNMSANLVGSLAAGVLLVLVPFVGRYLWSLKNNREAAPEAPIPTVTKITLWNCFVYTSQLYFMFLGYAILYSIWFNVLSKHMGTLRGFSWAMGPATVWSLIFMFCTMNHINKLEWVNIQPVPNRLRNSLLIYFALICITDVVLWLAFLPLPIHAPWIQIVHR